MALASPRSFTSCGCTGGSATLDVVGGADAAGVGPAASRFVVLFPTPCAVTQTTAAMTTAATRPAATASDPTRTAARGYVGDGVRLNASGRRRSPNEVRDVRESVSSLQPLLRTLATPVAQLRILVAASITDWTIAS